MALLKILISEAFGELWKARGREIACVSLLLLSASCVPLRAAPAPSAERQATGRVAPSVQAQAHALAQAAPEPEPMALRPVDPSDAAAMNAAIAIADAANPRAASIVFRARSPIDQQRALECLSEAIYYESRSEAEEGQRAVAQVVLNRVRHPAYPASVCGVVYQGPQRPGGGCQFTFTCDGSLTVRPAGFGWAQARRIAAEALAGRVHAAVGHATHYHTHQVLPVWAYRLAKVAVIGSHNFYRMPGAWGMPGAFRTGYAGREQAPSALMATRLPAYVPMKLPAAAPMLATSLPEAAYYVPPAAQAQANKPQLAPESHILPESQIRPEYRNSGRWLSDAPKPSAPVSR